MSRGEAGQYVQGNLQTLQRSGTDPWIYKLLARAGSCFRIPLFDRAPSNLGGIRRLWIGHCNWALASGWYHGMLLHDRQLPLALSEYEVSFARLDAARADPTSPLQLSAGLKWEHSMWKTAVKYNMTKIQIVIFLQGRNVWTVTK